MTYPLTATLMFAAGLLAAQPRPVDSSSGADSLLQAAATAYFAGGYVRVVDMLQPSLGTALSPRASYYLGSAFAALNDHQNAIRYLRMAVDSAGGEIPYRLSLAKSLSAYGSVADARVQYRAILAQDSACIPALSGLGALCFDGRDYQIAADLFARTIRLNPRDFLACYNLGASLVNLGRPDSAMQYLHISLTLNLRYVPAMSLLASLYYKRKRYQDAERLYGMILARDTTNAENWARSGYCVEKLKEWVKALKCFRTAAILDTANATYLAHLGQAYYELKGYDSAAAAYIRAGSLEEENPVLFLNAGLAYASMDSAEKALGAFRRSFAEYHIERIGFLYSQIAGVYYKGKRFRRAGQAYRTALGYDGGNKRAFFFLARSEDELHQYQPAASDYRRFLRLAAGDAAQGDLVPYARKRLRELSTHK